MEYYAGRYDWMLSRGVKVKKLQLTVNDINPSSMLHKYKNVIAILLSLFFLGCFFLFSVIVKKHKLTQFDFNMTVYVQDDIPLKLDKVFQYFSSLASVEGMSVLLLIILIEY